MKKPFAILILIAKATAKTRGKDGRVLCGHLVKQKGGRLKEPADRPKTSLLWLSCFIVQ